MEDAAGGMVTAAGDFKMKLSVLADNTASGTFLAEHGLSYFIEHDIKILFDTGHSDVFLKNAEALSINLDDADYIVLSHGHWDHGNGLKYLRRKPLICHPTVFDKKFRLDGRTPNGMDLTYDDAVKQFELGMSSEPVELSENIIFLGEIPRTTSFESKETPFVDEKGIPDFIKDDSALAVIDNGELVVVSGCAHSGICNIIEYAKKVTGIDKIRTVIGGFHLKDDGEQTQKTVKYFRKASIRYICPSHCNELPALAALYNEFKIRQVKSGMVLDI